MRISTQLPENITKISISENKLAKRPFSFVRFMKLGILAVIGFTFLSFSGWSQINIGATLPATVTQNFDGLGKTPQTWTDNTTPLVGWYSTTSTINSDIGTATISNVYNYGTSNATDRALGALTSSSTPTQQFGVRLKNNSSSAITSIYVSYTGEQWRQNTVSQTLAFSYQVASTVTSITSGSWTNATPLDFVSPNITTAGPLDGNLTANRTAKTSLITVSIPAGSEIMLRWTQAGSNSHGLAIDDLSVTALAVTPTITVSAASLNFEKVYTGFHSLPLSYTVTGANLATDITVAAPTGMEVSKTCGSGWASSVTLTPASYSVNTTVYARYTGGAVSANITHSSMGAVTKNVSITETANSSNVGSYYSTITGTGATLKTNLYNIIKGHTNVSYAQLWTSLQTTDAKPDGSVWDMYTDKPCASSCILTFVTDQDAGSGGTVECDKYNREHSFPNSWFGGDVSANEASIAYTDLFHIIPADKYVNNARSNNIIGEVTSPTKTFVNGGKLGPNDVSGSGYIGTAFEPIDEYKGDFARAYFYMVTRYQPDQAAWESITTDGDVILDGTTYPSIEPWVLTMLLDWNNLDPVDQKEMSRNDAIYNVQHNRNPYIDHPEYVAAVWVTAPTLLVSPVSISGFTYILDGGPSVSQSFNLSGINLTGYTANITITAPTNFEVSTDNSSFAVSKTVQFISATLASTPIYVRLKSGLSVNSYSGNITLTGGGDADGAIVALSGSVTSLTPTLTVTPTSLTSFTYVSGAGPSTSQPFSLSGTYLTGFPSNISISAPTDYEISTDNSSFSASLSIPYTSATLTSNTIYVRLKTGLSVNTYSESVSLSGGGDVDGASVSVSGAVTSSGGGSTVCLSEGFNAAPTAPTDWTFTNIASTYTSAGNFGVSSPSLKLDATGDIIETPSVSNAIELKFWNKAQTSTGSSILIEGYNGSSWSTIENIVYSAAYNTANTKTYNSSSTPALAVGYTKFRFSYTKSTSNWALDDVEVTCASSSPALSVSPSTLTGFTYVSGSGPSTTQSYNLSGSDLTGYPSNIVVTAPTDYEISLSSGSGYVASINVAYSSATLASTPVYVRLKAGLAVASYNSENISNAGGGATTMNVTCGGSVTSPPSPILSVSASTLSGFTYVSGSGPSTSQTYNLSGSNLNPAAGNIAVSAPTNYEVSTNNSTFSSSVLVAYTGSALASTAIYVRLKLGLAIGSYNSELIANAGGGATTMNVTCSGSVTSAAPTISLSSSTLTGFTYVLGAGPSLVQSYTLSGSSLSGSGVITVTGSTNYEVSTDGSTWTGSPIAFAYASGIITGQPKTVYVRLKSGLPVASYNSETISNAGGGAATVNATCSGSVTAAAGPSCASDLIISEYIEGSSNNKAIEIFNGTGASVNLASYSLKKQTNGAGAFANELVLIGTLINGATYTIVNSSAVAGMLALANRTEASLTTFNGNDAIALYKSGVQIDVVGIVNQVTPDWGANVTLVRKSTIISPTISYSFANWDSYTTDNYTNLGAHSMSCNATWSGTTSTDWSVSSNWSSNLVPTNEDVFVPSTPSNQPQITSASTCHNLTIKPGASLTINDTKSLAVGGDFLIQSDATGTGSFVDKNTTSGLSVTGTSTVQKYLTYNRWWYIGSPLSSSISASSAFGTLGGATGVGKRLWYYVEANHAYTAVASGDPINTALRGYSFKDYTNEITNASFTGTLNTGPIGSTNNLTRQTSGTFLGYNLVCNPYPSAIDLGTYDGVNGNNTGGTHNGLTISNLATTVWYNNGSSFCTYNWASGTGQGSPAAQRYVPAMQAFWVRVATGTLGTLNINNDARTHNAQAFYKKSAETNIFRMEVSRDTLKDELVVGFYASASDAYDPYDSEKMFSQDNANPQVYTLTQDLNYVAINGETELITNEMRIVPVGFKTNVSGMFTLHATNLIEFDPAVSVYLEDAQTATVQDLRQNASYSFTSGAINSANRFRLHFGSMTTGIVDNGEESIFIYSYKNTVYVNIPAGEGMIEIYDMLGRKLVSAQSITGMNKFDLATENGMYLVKTWIDGIAKNEIVLLNK